MHKNPRLIFNAATEKWLLGYKDDFWSVRATSDALTLANFMQIHVVDQSTSEYLIVSKGHATVKNQGETDCLLALTPFSGGKSRNLTIYPETADFGLIDCLYGFYEDQWIETEATFGLENVLSLALKFFLPESSELGDKAIECFVDDKRVQSAVIQRGEPQEIWIDIPAQDSKRQELVIKADYKEPNATDERSLGMIFVEYNANLTDWKPAKELL